jgi:DNA-binding response OmpR family regulator
MEILIIDDDTDDCAIISDMLKTILPKVSCIVIESGEAAIKYLRQPVSIPNYIFLDITMSGMDGKETLLKIKGLKSCSRTPVIMYSGHNDEHEKVIYRKLGANGYISKTSSMDRLKSDICTVITV